MVIVGGVFFLIQRVQNNIITPVLMEKQLGVNSVLILISALLGAIIMGFWGVVLSVPLAVIVGLFIDEQEETGEISDTKNDVQLPESPEKTE